jgi:hypothetical protein
MNSEQFADIRHETKPIDKFGEGVTFFFANTVGDDMRLAGKPESGGLPRVVPQSLFCYT